jgi:anti-sigma regulatory factor (Ser/Thr protein kinase)
VVALGERNAGLVRAALPADSPVTYLDGGATYARPASAIRSFRSLLARHVAEGAGQIRIIGELSAATFGAPWNSWARYESAINHAYDEFPLWSMCAYDVRETPEPVLADVLRTHPRTARPGDRHEVNQAYVDPRTFLGEWRPLPPEPLQGRPPRVDLTDPSPAEARQAVRGAAPAALSAAVMDDFVVAVSEVVTNAQRHGRPPSRMRIWPGSARLVVTVCDRGDGPKDPFAGLLPAAGTGGLGLWITHQACDHVALGRDESGFTVRLTAGDLDGE